ncbi:MAG: hypothetical protein ACREWI_06405 [Telluria sp.]
MLRHSLALGLVAFGGYGTAAFVYPEFAKGAALIGFMIALVAGYFQANSDDFFAGVALSMVCWVLAVLGFGTAEQRISLIYLVSLVFLLTFILGSILFFTGRLLARGARAVRKSRDPFD